MNNGRLKAIIKKHGSEIYLCPKELIPYKLLDFSDKAFSELNKKIIEHPYEIAGIKDYEPAKKQKYQTQSK